MSADMHSHTVRCVSCRFTVTSSDWATVKNEAQIHEDEGHHVQVYPAGPIIAPLPRVLWT